MTPCVWTAVADAYVLVALVIGLILGALGALSMDKK